MPRGTGIENPAVDAFVREVIQRYRTKLLDLSSRNPLISFRHSERSRSHVRIVDEIPEVLFGKLNAGKEFYFSALPDPELIPPDETTPMFLMLLRRATSEDQTYREALNEVGPEPSPRQRQKIERELRNRVRLQLGLAPFQPTWDPQRRARELDINPDYELPVLNGHPSRRHNDSKIQTLFFAEDLERKVSVLRDAARVLEKDAGYSALYCAFGYLEYYDTDHSSEKRHAPLIFLPVTLDRQLVNQRYLYFIQPRNEDIQVNVALAELLRQMAVTLPAWVDDENEDDPLGSYLKQVEQAISGKRDWKVRRYVTVGLFTFSTLAMYKDLDPDRWPSESPLEQRAVVRTLIAGAEVSELQYADDYEIDSLQGPEPLLITDADSSQHSAVVDVLRGKSSQVIQGPPGTGKSQTITNIIAAALNEGLSVLFIAEKMAALEVVKKRLDDAGLNAFCLELHSSKTSKTAVITSLAERLEYHPPRHRADQATANGEALAKAREELLHYVQRINEDAGKTGLKVYDVLLGSALRDEFRGELPAGIVDARFANALNIAPYSYRQMFDAAGTLEAQMHALSTFGRLADHPWRGFQNIEVTELDQSRVFSALDDWNRGLIAVLDGAKNICARIGSVPPSSSSGIESLCRQLIAVPEPPSHAFVPETYRALSGWEAREQMRRVLDDFQSLVASENSLSAHCENVAAAIKRGSRSLTDALATLRDLGIEEFTVSSVIELKGSSQRKAELMARLTSYCESLSTLAGLTLISVNSLRAIGAAVELLARLPRPVWSKRLPTVIDEANQPLLERSANQAAELSHRRAELNSEFDLDLLPGIEELRAHGLALRTANPLMALLSSPCRRARRLYRSIVRNSERKRHRQELADGLIRCAQYCSDHEGFKSNGAMHNVCGTEFADLATPFSELLQVSHWATDVRQRLALFGDIGLAVQEFLFTANISRLDRLFANRDQEAFSSLTNVLADFAAQSNATWSEIVDSERVRASTVREAADLFTAAQLRPTCSQADLASTIKALEAAEVAANRISGNAVGMNLVGGSLTELRDNRRAVQETLTFAERISVLELPTGFILHFYEDSQNIATLRAAARSLLDNCSIAADCATTANKVAQLDAALWCGAEVFDQAPMQKLLDRNQRALANVGALRDYVSFLLAEDAACDQGIGPVLSVYSATGEDYRNLQRAMEFVFYRSAAEAILNNDPRLRRHSGATHQELRNRFRALDREYLELKRRQLAVRLTQRAVPPGNWTGPVADLTELALVTRVAGQTRPRIMVRDLMSRSGKAIQALMPCWLMSPMSVAQYLDPHKLHFDVVIMDEASQIRPEEALGGLARGTKAVIVGDQMQLPPTPFFQKLSMGEGNEDDEFSQETEQDSILEAAAGRFYPARRLRWHYRSEHDSLIAFSNREFYENDLTVFPSPFYDHPEYGVSLVQTGGIYKAGLNQIEGKAIVKAAVDFMKAHSNQSLGLVAVNAKQAEFIRELLDKEIASDPDAAAYAQQWNGKLEDYFVKNLENVQGDERDVIFVSTVYGKDEKGSFFQRFGPINGIYGHRRLNVLFTRAKKKVTVFTSMVPEDIQDEGKHLGVGVLKRYLQYARDGVAIGAVSSGEECDSEFERWVLQVLKANGYDAVPQVGVCGYRIDIAVRHPAKRGVFLCGIECDGATYHSARSVRERDRLRQEILERYNWTLYRIWSTDWFRNPALQTKQMLTYLQQLHPAICEK